MPASPADRTADTVIASYQFDPDGRAAAAVRMAASAEKNAARRAGALEFAETQVEWVAGQAVSIARLMARRRFARLQEEWPADVPLRRAKRFSFSDDSDEAREVVAEAVALLFREVFWFDPRQCPAGGSVEGLFRGWFHRNLLTCCTRHSLRIGNAGTYNATSRAANSPPSVPLSCLSLSLTAPELDDSEPEPLRFDLSALEIGEGGNGGGSYSYYKPRTEPIPHRPFRRKTAPTTA